MSLFTFLRLRPEPKFEIGEMVVRMLGNHNNILNNVFYLLIDERRWVSSERKWIYASQKTFIVMGGQLKRSSYVARGVSEERLERIRTVREHREKQ